MAVFSSTGSGNTVRATRTQDLQNGGTVTTTSIDTPDASAGEPGRGRERVATGAVVDPKMPILVGPDAAPTIPEFDAPGIPDPQPAPEETQSNRAQGSKESTEPPADTTLRTTDEQVPTVQTTGQEQAAGGTSGASLPVLGAVALAILALLQ